MRALALIDGEHYAPVVRAALEELPYEFVAAHLVGGKEKLRDDADYGVPLAETLEGALDQHRPEVVVDLSDEPVLGPIERFRVASQVLLRGLPYVGADFRFDPPTFEPFPLPSIGIVGTGKRVGKTAIAAHAASLLARERRVVVVSMGRGGPPEPDVAEIPPTVEALLELSDSGRHAASDYLETAALAGVPTVGCRRCGGGLAGAVFASNVAEGARKAVELDPELVLFDGSGAALPPIETSRRILVVNAQQDPAVVTGYLNEYRYLLSDLVVLTMAEEGSGWEALRKRAAELAPKVVGTMLRPRPVEPVEGRRVAFFSTAPPSAHEGLAKHLGEEHGAEVVHVSSSLANRTGLRKELETVDADVFLVELKAAAIDVVAAAGRERGVKVVLAGSDVLPAKGEPDLDSELLRLAEEACG
ncbi:MAG: 2,3-diphosphoglycerate synthetase [Actinobacteria bacterium]|nr:2,3-diphosphoglycerate synthetase [Actinomycetota bacterium]